MKDEGRSYQALKLQILASGTSRGFLGDVERMYISSLRRSHHLTNVSDGGWGGFTGEAARQKQIVSNLGNTHGAGVKHSEASRRQKGASLRRHYVEHPETAEAISAAHLGNTYALGYHHTEEAKKAISEKQLGRQYALGVVHSLESNLAKSVGLFEYNADPGTQDARDARAANQAVSLQATFDSPEGVVLKKQISNSVTLLWQDPEYRARQLASRTATREAAAAVQKLDPKD
jgi:hypothetical protein